VECAWKGLRLRFATGRSGVRLLVVAMLAALLLTGVARADDVFVDVAINGHLREGGALVYGDRSYVRLSDVAEILGGRYVYDRDLNVAFVLTGVYRNLVVDRLTALNPELEAYNPIAAIAVGRGIQYGVPGPHLSVNFTPSGVVTGFAVLYTDRSIAHRPWFDQPDARLEEFPGIGWAYSQHLYLVDPDLIELGGETQVAFNGRRLSLPTDAFRWVGDDLYVRLRDLAQASGGGVGWDPGTRLATAKVVAGADLTLRTLRSLNERAIAYYERAPNFDAQVGYPVEPAGPGIRFGLDGEGRVTAFGVGFPESSGPWFPWFDQQDGAAVELAWVGRGYSQHIYVQERSAISE